MEHRRDDPAQPGAPLTADHLADLQAGLLDEGDAARLRRRIRADDAARQTMHALEQTRSTLAALGDDPDSAPEVPPGLATRIGTRLRNEHTVAAPARPGTPAHAVRPRPATARLVAAGCGVTAVAVLAALGTTTLLRTAGPTPSTPASANLITVTPTVPLSARELAALVGRRPDFGPLADQKRRAACLGALGYPGSQQILGAAPVQINGRPALVLVLPGDRPADLVALAVAPNCSAVDTGLIADTTVTRP